MKQPFILFRNLLICTFLAVVFVSCNENECIDPIDTLALTGIASSDSDVTLDYDSLSIITIASDTVYILEESTSVISEAYLVLNPNENQSQFKFYADVNDTITIYHDMELEFISSTCGFAPVFYVSDIEHTTNRIDSIRIINSTVSPDDVQNFTIYLRDNSTSTDE